MASRESARRPPMNTADLAAAGGQLDAGRAGREGPVLGVPARRRRSGARACRHTRRAQAHLGGPTRARSGWLRRLQAPGPARARRRRCGRPIPPGPPGGSWSPLGSRRGSTHWGLPARCCKRVAASAGPPCRSGKARPRRCRNRCPRRTPGRPRSRTGRCRNRPGRDTAGR